MDIFAEDLDPIRRSQLYHRHGFVKAISELAFGSRKNRKEVGTEIINMAEQIYKEKRIDRIEDEDALEKYLQKRFEVKRMRSDGVFPFVPWSMYQDDDDDTQKQEAIKQAIKRAVSAIRYFTEETTKFYFAKAHEYGATGIISKEPPKLSNEPPPGSGMVDLASLPDNNTCYLITNSILAEELEREPDRIGKKRSRKGIGEMNDTRVPIFLVLDEAHNFVPEEPRNRAEEALRDQFRTIAAEGRKYGVFLILVSQRPDKLDHLILPECANKAIMRLDSRTIPQLVRGKNWVCSISTLICWRKQFSSERAGY